MSQQSPLPTPLEVRHAAVRIGGVAVHTPLRHSPTLSAKVGGEVFLKLESEQVGGSFKVRGALNALLALAEEELALGIVASSAGNHGLGIAIAAERLAVRATVFVPFTAPVVKRAAIEAHGARVDASQPNYDAAEAAAQAFARETGATFVGPCTGRTLLAGAGTVGMEILEDLPHVGTVIVPVGGGGLCGGVGGYIRGTAKDVRIIGVQSERTNAMSLALGSGRATTIPDRPTLAEGLAGLVNEEMLAQGEAALDSIMTVSEDDIAESIAWLHRAEALVVEGAGAVGVAALRSGALKPIEWPAVVVISGANIDKVRWEGIVAEDGPR
ncbi:MAG TPA: pyridoxal-phosphate dependent enzyme [Gemmatimonadaceae bacterium]|nr:pyridoxal-phosphate dependent enzyme [Gemmatimonadaceae bacterium]